MAKIVASKNGNSKKGFKIFVWCLLLTAAGVVLYGIPPFLLDINRIVQSAVGKFSGRQAGLEPAASVLRGTIYDRNFNELAVSYQLYTLSARPADLPDLGAAAQALAQASERPAEVLERGLKSSRRIVKLADNLGEQQAKAVEALNLPGVLCTPVSYRFYPAHAAAAHVLGFMDDRAGLAGVEGRYDTALSARALGDGNLPDIDRKGHPNLGAQGIDLILTLDLRLQRHLEQMLQNHLKAQGLEKGMALLLEPGTGRILALVNQPSFNPNYFWKAQEGNRVNRVYSQLLDRDLIRPLLARAAAIERNGLDGAPLLPPTVAAPDYGFSDSALDAFARRIRLYDPVSGSWEGGPSQSALEGEQEAVTGVQIGAALASLVNGGWRITPYVVDSIYDRASRDRLYRKTDVGRAHVLDPALGVQVRRALFADWISKADDKILYRADSGRPGLRTTQRLFAGMTPVRYPKYLLVIAEDTGQLRPVRPGVQNKGVAGLTQLGRDMLAYVEKNPPQAAGAGAPPARSEENMRQFLIGKRLAAPKNPHEIAAKAATMPSLKGLSLRKALQLLDPYKLKVSVRGSGRVVDQSPRAGASLSGAGACLLTLDER